MERKRKIPSKIFRYMVNDLPNLDINSHSLNEYIKKLYPKSYYPLNFSDLTAWASLCEKISKNYLPFQNENIKISTDRKYSEDTTQYITEKPILDKFLRAELIINNILFMSITPMEILSHINQILWANGTVLVAGLGMGYYVNIIKQKPEVRHIIVVEQNPSVIQAYIQVFGNDPKIEIIQGDIFEYESTIKFDFVYIDIWSNFEFSRIDRDMRTLTDRISSELFSFWGIELYCNDYYNMKRVLLPELVKDLGFLEKDKNLKDIWCLIFLLAA